ncbi:hypothetical protein DVX13_11625 [Enterococcus faecium]|nr:hypothetical protein DVW98_11640 [Enterococcus faecium]TKN52318.1 hypothetical protein DVX13_11625 [Enterococcus faecium]
MKFKDQRSYRTKIKSFFCWESGFFNKAKIASCLEKLLSFFCIICQIKRDKTFHLRNSKKLLMVFGNLVIF